MGNFNIMKCTLLTFLFAFTLVSCIDEGELPVSEDDNIGIPEEFKSDYTLNLTVTLDNMGGTRAVSTKENPMAELENYIDPERFRVLFFDRQDRFIFESKSRWVKQLVPDEEDGYAEWLVSVPLFPYGNDKDYNWNWEEIRRVLTGEDLYDRDARGAYIYDEAHRRDVDANGKKMPAFKIMILTNRPDVEWNFGIKGRDDLGNDLDNIIITGNGWVIHNGPDWRLDQTRWGNDPKEVFDIHHCQYDPIYEGKNWDNRTIINRTPQRPNVATPTSKNNYRDWGVYDFILGGNRNDPDLLSATSTWVDFGTNDNRKETIGGQTARMFMPLTKEHPIPMYGIQEFEKIENWTKGVPFNVSKITSGQAQSNYGFKSVSMLRSVVKLELVLPQEPDWIMLIYSNIYARCEPMDVWTPTELIWDHSTGAHVNENTGSCEWYDIKRYGRIARDTDPVITNNYKSDGSYQLNGNYKYFDDVPSQNQRRASVNAYQERMSWFYGAWIEKGWDFNGRQNLVTAVNRYNNTNSTKSPRIFNSCVQRNQWVSCKQADMSDKYDDGQYHYVVYTGERNINDPSQLIDMGNDTSGAPVVCYWMFKIGNYVYALPIANHNNSAYPTGVSDYANAGTGLWVQSWSTITNTANGVYKGKLVNIMNPYEKSVMSDDTNTIPWPLLRNHVYRIRVNNIRTRSNGASFSASGEEFHSETLKFK